MPVRSRTQRRRPPPTEEPTRRIPTRPRQLPIPETAPPPVPSSALGGLGEQRPTEPTRSFFDRQDWERRISELVSPLTSFGGLLTKNLRAIYGLPTLFGGQPFDPSAGAGFPPRGVTRERFLRTTQQYGQGPSRLALGAPEVITQADLPTAAGRSKEYWSRLRQGGGLGVYVRIAKRLMSGLDQGPLYDPGAYYPGGVGGDAGGGVVVVRGGGTPGSQGRNYKSGLINWRI